jgi:hypothetical protein
MRSSKDTTINLAPVHEIGRGADASGAASIIAHSGNAPGHRARLTRWAFGRVGVLLAAAVVTLVASPMLFTKSGFAVDFTNQLWLAWVAGKALAQAGHPSYFFNANNVFAGVFYPWFAFYGGTLATITGGISELLGGRAVIAFVGVTTIAIAGSYAGMLWLGREFRLRGWTSHMPALVVVTSAYYITNLYGRGAWAEFIAVAALPPLVASGVHLVRTDAWRPWPMLVFAVAVVVFTGSHNITLVWGTSIAVAALLIIWLALGAPRRLPYRRLSMVAVLGLTSALVNAWFLFPDIAYEGRVVAHSATPFSWASTSFFNTPAVLLNPLRSVPSQSTTPALFVQVPDWFLAWGLLTGALLLWRRPAGGGLRRVWIAMLSVVVLVLGMMMLQPFWTIVPSPFNEIQFPYRLGSYVFYAVAGLVLVSALALQRASAVEGSRRTVAGLRLGLLAVCAVSVGLCVWQLWAANTMSFESYPNRSEALASPYALPRTWYDGGSYHDAQSPVVNVPANRFLIIDPSEVRGDRFAAWMSVPPGPEPIQTNIGGGGYLVHISGLERLGRGLNNLVVVRRTHGGSGPVYVVVETAHTLVTELGRALSILAILALLAILVIVGVRGHRTRRRTDRQRSRRSREPAAASLD